MSPRKVADPGPSPTPRTRSTRPSSIASSSKQTLDRVPTETRLSGSSSPRTIPKEIVPLTVSESGAPQVSGKGKGKAMGIPAAGMSSTGTSVVQSKRVLPARLRRAAGGGQDGVRDLEEMIVDWLDRYGA